MRPRGPGRKRTSPGYETIGLVAYLALLLSLLAVDLLAAISPGPNFVVVTEAAVRHTRRYALAVVFGVMTANLVWCSAVVFGLAALFGIVPALYGVIKFLGGIYLIYLGVRLWRHAGAPMKAGAALKPSLLAAYGRGLLTNLTNPKSAVYSGSIFTLFTGPTTPAWVRVTAVGIVLADTLLWYGSVAAFFSTTAVQRRYSAIRRPLDRAAGVVMMGFGSRLVLLRA